MSVWSDGRRKNWPLIEFIDQNIDASRFHLTLVGRLPSSVHLHHSSHIAPLKQRHLGELLRGMDVFIAPSYNECFSNAETQALACGLPVLALDDSSHREVVGGGGRFFRGQDDVLQELTALVAGYSYYEQRAEGNDIDDVAVQYLTAARLV
jgi:glycosyltransferase involved in cell wall biosynthesis